MASSHVLMLRTGSGVAAISDLLVLAGLSRSTVSHPPRWPPLSKPLSAGQPHSSLRRYSRARPGFGSSSSRHHSTATATPRSEAPVAPGHPLPKAIADASSTTLNPRQLGVHSPLDSAPLHEDDIRLLLLHPEGADTHSVLQAFSALPLLPHVSGDLVAFMLAWLADRADKISASEAVKVVQIFSQFPEATRRPAVSVLWRFYEVAVAPRVKNLDPVTLADTAGLLSSLQVRPTWILRHIGSLPEYHISRSLLPSRQIELLGHCVRWGYPASNLVRCLVSGLLAKPEDVDDMELVQLLRSCGSLRQSRIKDIDRLVDICLERNKLIPLAVRSPSYLASLAWVCVYFPNSALSQQLLGSVDAVCTKKAAELSPSDLCDWLDSLAARPTLPAEIDDRILEELLESKRFAFNVDQLFRFACLLSRFPESTAVNRILSIQRNQLKALSSSTLCRVMRILSEKDVLTAEHTEDFAKLISERVEELHNRDFVWTAAYFSTSYHVSSAYSLFRALARSATSRLDELGYSEIIRLVEAFSSFSCDSQQFFRAALTRLMPVLSHLPPQQVISLLCSLEAVNFKPALFFRHISSAIIRRRHALSCEQLETVVRAYSRLGLSSPPLLSSIVRTYLSINSNWTGSRIKMLIIACTNSGSSAPRLFKKLARLAETQSDSLSRRDMTKIAQCYRRMGLRHLLPPRFLDTKDSAQPAESWAAIKRVLLRGFGFDTRRSARYRLKHANASVMVQLRSKIFRQDAQKVHMLRQQLESLRNRRRQSRKAHLVLSRGWKLPLYRRRRADSDSEAKRRPIPFPSDLLGPSKWRRDGSTAEADLEARSSYAS
ncbi:uncharacterized protein BJ171DRAFT_512807 [Polychytrium aggregatum]|uniref:uncharacterized protein n=1 Tax=Polychytrium aggregatum TaxID=110093 RepID=UPI0022FEC565|nr:uncharacterized protein BJ171DRAFT_512807 [Polychytrium aggregatum]KAI9202645.1 hypothetical protein BJ171DRAFT_512807 [Polychytrium aggregatum]